MRIIICHYIKKCSVVNFIRAEKERPIEMLSEFNQFVFDDKDDDKAITTYLISKETTEDIKIACGDLKVLGKTDFKKLLKWRIAMRDIDPELVAKLQEKNDKEKKKKKKKLINQKLKMKKMKILQVS